MNRRNDKRNEYAVFETNLNRLEPMVNLTVRSPQRVARCGMVQLLAGLKLSALTVLASDTPAPLGHPEFEYTRIPPRRALQITWR
jgi:hypothetical protein